MYYGRKNNDRKNDAASLFAVALFLTLFGGFGVAGCGGGVTAPPRDANAARTEAGAVAPPSTEESVVIADAPPSGESGLSQETAGEESDTAASPVESEAPSVAELGVESATSRATKYDWVWTPLREFGSRAHRSDALVNGNTQVFGDIRLKSPAGNAQISSVSQFYVKTSFVSPPAGTVSKIAFRGGTKTLNWTREGNALKAVVDAPAYLYIYNRNTKPGVLHMEVVDTASPGRVGDKVRVWFTSTDRVYANRKIFDFTTDSSAGSGRGSITLGQNWVSAPTQ